MSSFGESKTKKLLEEAESAEKLVEYNCKQISRIYPGAKRQDSSNLKVSLLLMSFDPGTWNVLHFHGNFNFNPERDSLQMYKNNMIYIKFKTGVSIMAYIDPGHILQMYLKVMEPWTAGCQIVALNYQVLLLYLSYT